MIIYSVKEAVGSYLNSTKTLAVAVSGGADSMALLNIMLSIKDEYGIDVFAAHFNHKLRGVESDRDMQFVENFCKERGVKLICGEGDVSLFAKEQKLSTELAARQMRYDFFSKLPADMVATAHTASDNLETVLLNLTRGTGINGLCGIPPKRDKYIRPLIFCTREDIEKYCFENHIDFITDSTNLSDNYSRNRIRHNIVPILKQLNPSVEKNVTNMVCELAFDRDMLDNMAKQEYSKRVVKTGLNVQNLTSLTPALSGRVLRIFYAEKAGTVPDYRHTDDLFDIAVNGGRCSIKGGIIAQRQKNILKIIDTSKKPQYKVTIKKSKKVNNLLAKNVLDCDKIVGDLIVRIRKPGDKIRLAGRGCTKTLKCLYNEKGLSDTERETLPVIADDEGPVWICGIGVSERAKINTNTKSVYLIDYEIVQGGNNK